VQSLPITAADELTIAQAATSITVEHPSKLGSHPRAATHRFESYGTVGGAGERFRSDVFWFGDQLVIETTNTEAPDAKGRTRTIEVSEMWSVDGSGRLVIDCAERQSGAAGRSAKLTYKKRYGALESCFPSAPSQSNRPSPNTRVKNTRVGSAVLPARRTFRSTRSCSLFEPTS
jgi:hypothetical protein